PDIVDAHPGVVLRAPGLDVSIVEPGVVPWHEVLPLQDLQRLGLGLNLVRDKHPHARCHGRHACRLEKRPSRDPERRAVPHTASPSYCCVRWARISTPPSRKALYLTASAPLLKDTLHLRIRLVEGLLGRQLARGGLGKHGGDHPGIENLVDGSVGITGVPD